MGPIEILLAIFASWVMVAVVFVAGFVVGRFNLALSGEQKLTLPRRGKTVPALKAQSPVAGVDVKAEREKIVSRAKSEFKMSQTEAERFADEITKQGVKELGRLHSQG